MQATNPARILYLATGVFDKGGIARYSRYQIQALRDILGDDAVRVFSLWGHGPNDFEESFGATYSGSGISLQSKVAFSLRALYESWRYNPTIIWVNTINLLPLAQRLQTLKAHTRIAVNIYGLELWSGRENQLRRTLPKADRVISDCHFSADYALDTFGLDPERLSIIWDCVDVERFAPKPRRPELLQKYGIPDGTDRRYLLTLGRLSAVARHKGYDRLIDAMHSWRHDSNIICLIAGDGDDRPRLEERIRAEGLQDRVKFLGSVPESDLADIFNLCHVFTLVSDRGFGRGEGIPLTPLEAAACGKPILVGDEDGSQEAVIEGQNGYIVSPHDMALYKERVELLMSDDELRTRMGQAARQRIEAEFSYEDFREKTAQVLRTLNV